MTDQVRKIVAVKLVEAMPVQEFVKWMRDEQAKHAEPLYLQQLPGKFFLTTEGRTCHCRKCSQVERELLTLPGEVDFGGQFMILCTQCGNKRCPHATDHTLACTESNEQGQPGSYY